MIIPREGSNVDLYQCMHLTFVLLTRLQNHELPSRAVFQVVQLVSKLWFSMRTQDGYDAQDSYERAEDAMGENACNRNDDIESNGRRFQETPSDVASTMRSLIKAQEEQHELNAAML